MNHCQKNHCQKRTIAKKNHQIQRRSKKHNRCQKKNHHSTLSKHKQRTRGGGRFRRQDVGPGQFRVGGLPFGAAGQMFVGRNHQQPQHKIDISKIPQFGVHLVAHGEEKKTFEEEKKWGSCQQNKDHKYSSVHNAIILSCFRLISKLRVVPCIHVSFISSVHLHRPRHGFHPTGIARSYARRGRGT